MTYPYKPHQIQEFMKQDKCLSPGDKLDVQGSGTSSTGLHFETRPQLKDGPFVDCGIWGKLRFRKNPQATIPASCLRTNVCGVLDLIPLEGIISDSKGKYPKGGI